MERCACHGLGANLSLMAPRAQTNLATGQPFDGDGFPERPPLWVLDTNVVLDWLLFQDAAMLAPSRRLMRGGAWWIATAAMQEEALEVATRNVFARRGAALDRRERVASGFTRHATLLADPLPCHADTPALRCADPDDQRFIDLALSRSARLLLTRDKALLALAAAARTRGLLILRPQDWAMPDAAG